MEKEASSLRAEYLAWIYELGETNIKDKRLIDHLEIRPGFSFWWMTQMAQKFNALGTSQIDNAIKALALGRFVSKYSIDSIHLVSGNEKLALTLKKTFSSMNVFFKWDEVKQENIKISLIRVIYNALPGQIKALIYLFMQLIKSLPVIFKNKKNDTIPNSEICFIDVLAHLDKETFDTNTFISNYWTKLTDIVSRMGIKTTWVHNYFYQESIPSMQEALKLLKKINHYNRDGQFHILLDANVSISVFIKALRDYCKIYIISLGLSGLRRKYEASDSYCDLWPLLKNDWIDSVKGKCAMMNCLTLSLYERTFSLIPFQKIGVYIQENQPWEMALNYAWKSAGHGKLIGTPHTTVRFWDLRYFYDSRSYRQSGCNELPMPDLVAVNGPVAEQQYLQAGYPVEQIAQVEALRFLHLREKFRVGLPRESSISSLKVLICGDFLAKTNGKLLSWLSIAAKSLPMDTTYILKPHPAYPVKIHENFSLPMEITHAPLSELLFFCDVVFTSNITSAAVDAYCSGIPVIQMLDGNSLNISPLRHLDGVVYVTNPEELSDALRNVSTHTKLNVDSYFFLDEKLPLWCNLLGINNKECIRH